VIERLGQLVKAVDGCLYTDPAQSVIYAYPRYPTPAWHWDEEAADLSIPAAALIDLGREPDQRPLYNGVWVGGTVAGVLAQAFISGTAGDLLAPQVLDPLIADSEGIAARARAIAALSASGPGTNLALTTILPPAPAAPGIIRPGLLVNVDGTPARARRVSIKASRSGGLDSPLTVRQSVTLERRENTQ
jgi:hypothetical protein